MKKQFPHSDEQVRELITAWIDRKENPGERSGGSGHLSQLSYHILRIDDPEELEIGWKISFQYEVEIYTEFTYLPDNPPHRYTNEGMIMI